VLHEHNGRIIVHKPLTVVRADMPRLREAFHNLITNALKYNTNHEKKIEIGMALESTPSRPIFYVRDNGIGIDAKYHDEIFRIFRRLNDEDDTVKGVGVGLTFVKKIIERHDGRIWLDSKPGHGTTFYFSIPQQQEVRR
jgi:light-regulated signal transduction histidine kinase (bacteriophytochrome)